MLRDDKYSNRAVCEVVLLTRSSMSNASSLFLVADDCPVHSKATQVATQELGSESDR